MVRNTISRIAFITFSLLALPSCAQSEKTKNHAIFTRTIAQGNYYSAAQFAVDKKLFTGEELKAQVKELCSRQADSEVKKLESLSEGAASDSSAQYTWFWQNLTDLSIGVGNREESCGYARSGFDTAVKNQENLMADHFYHQNLRCMRQSDVPSNIAKQHDDMVYGQWHYYALRSPDVRDSEFLNAHPYDRAYVQKICENEIAVLDFDSARAVVKNGNLGAVMLFKVNRAESLHLLDEALSKKMYQTAHYLIKDRAQFLKASDISNAVRAEYERALKVENARHAYALARSFALPSAFVRRAEKQMIVESIRRGDFSIGKMLSDGTVMIIDTIPRNSNSKNTNYLSYRRGW